MTDEKHMEVLENQGKILENIQSEIQAVKKEFQSKIKYDEQKENTINKLHDELQVYKRDLYKKMLLPMVNDIIHFTNRTEKDMVYLKDMPAEKLLQRMEDFLEDLRDILDRQGIEAYKLNTDLFDPKKQKILKTIETNDPHLDKKVASHKFFGYEWEDKVIKHEGVEVYLYKEDEHKTEEESTIDDVFAEPVTQQEVKQELKEEVKKDMKEEVREAQVASDTVLSEEDIKVTES